MDIVVTIVAFLLIFGLLIFVHELGHFLVAKRNGVKVEEFAFGLPLLPRIFGVKRGETTYSVYPVPLGGFVKMLGEDGGSRSKRSFASKSPGVRARILVAGVLMNFLLAFVLLTIGFLFKMDPLVLCAKDYPRATFQNNVSIAAVSETAPAKTAGLQQDDIIRRIAGESIDCRSEVPSELRKHPGEAVPVEIERAGQAMTLSVTPRAKTEVAPGTIGINPTDNYQDLDYPVWEAPYLALIESGAIIAATVSALGDVFTTLFTKASVPEGVAGPVGIAKITGEIVDLGAIMLLRFVAIISLSLAIFNLLPIPALDGGRLLFVGIEVLRRGKAVSAKVENAIHAVGFILLIALILFITYFDITR